MSATFDKVSKQLEQNQNPQPISIDRNDLNILEDEAEIDRELGE